MEQLHSRQSNSSQFLSIIAKKKYRCAPPLVKKNDAIIATSRRRSCDTIFAMATGAGEILELRLEPEGLSGRIRCPARMRPAPGQYLTASADGSQEPLPAVLFPSRIGSGELALAPPLPAGWSVGMQLALRGPLGRGFNMPATARRVALAGLDNGPARLLPLAEAALAQQAAVTIYADRPPPGLPEEVEVLPPELLPEALEWADFLALDTRPAVLPALRTRLGLKPHQQPGCVVQVLVTAAMPCSGLGECGVCAVTTRSGWALACTEGPVFDFQLLEG